jgi:hypothetical protein
MTLIETCRHQFIYDSETSEIVCSRGCGWSVPIFEDPSVRNAPAGRKLSSPSVENSGLGSDQNQVIQDLRHGTVNEVGKTVHLLSGGLRFFGSSKTHDEDLISELSNRLHGRVSDSDLAAIAAIYRRVLRNLEREKRRKAIQALDQITGRESRD